MAYGSNGRSILAGVVPSNSAPGQTVAGATPQRSADANSGAPWMLLFLIALYLFWAIVEQQQRVKDQVKPQNIGLNVRNLFAVALPVAIFFLLVKIAAVKWKGLGLPGGNTLVRVAGSL